MSLTKEARDALTSEQFAIPDGRRLPIHDEKHIRMAWGNVKSLPKTVRDDARMRIVAAASEMGIVLDRSVPDMTLACMSLEMPAVYDHPNRRPFKGILCRLGEPSDSPPGGSQGRKVVVTEYAADWAIPSLLGMGVNYASGFDGHDVKQKIGIIESAYCEAGALWISGFLYEADFPDEVSAIVANQGTLGFSFEARQIQVEDATADPLVITGLTFTGAAILLKSKAAYTSTSIAANAAGEIDMTKDELNKMVTDAVASALTASADAHKKAIDDLRSDFDKRLADASKAPVSLTAANEAATGLREIAGKLQAAGIGIAQEDGLVFHLFAMANELASKAAVGQVAQSYEIKAKADTSALDKAIADLKAEASAKDTKIADLEAKIAAAAKQPDRKTLPPAVTSLMHKTGLDEGDALSIDAINAAFDKAGISGQAAVKAKMALREAGRIQ